MRAITVCVDFSDILAISARWNSWHFEELWIVSSGRDQSTIKLYDKLMNEGRRVRLFLTEAFYDNGAIFNKWKALEEGLDAMGRQGWLCIMDADVLWPEGVGLDDDTYHAKCKAKVLKNIGKMPNYPPGRGFHGYPLDIGYLYTPLRRMWNEWPSPCTFAQLEEKNGVPLDSYWHNFPLHPQQHEWAGFTQIFHASDPALGSPPWHEINYSHAGTADSLFQMKWTREKKVRPPFEVLHLGSAGVNWMGRVTPFVDGTSPPEAEQRRAALHEMLEKRRGKSGMERFSHERL